MNFKGWVIRCGLQEPWSSDGRLSQRGTLTRGTQKPFYRPVLLSPLPHLRFVVPVPARNATLWVCRISRSPISAESSQKASPLPPTALPSVHGGWTWWFMPTEAASSLWALQVGAGPEPLGPTQPTAEKPVLRACSPFCAALASGVLVSGFSFVLRICFHEKQEHKQKNKTKQKVLVGILPGKSVSVWGLHQRFVCLLFFKSEWLTILAREGNVL